jgi:small GTP-binding protein
MISKKIILTGSFGVGKTSLFNRFVYQKFDEKYLTTIGVKIDKKSLTVNDKDITLLIWDIAGEVTQDKVPVSYFLGAAGIVYIIDLSRPHTFLNLSVDIEFLQKLLPDAAVMVVANKRDLLSEEELQELYNNQTLKWNFSTSAKTGENVEAMFQELGSILLNH